jgi:heme exporter protein D
MDVISEILHLGGYGLYVWPAYGAGVAILSWMAVSTLCRLRKTEKTLDSFQDMRRNAASAGPGATDTSSGEAGS